MKPEGWWWAAGLVVLSLGTGMLPVGVQAQDQDYPAVTTFADFERAMTF